MPRLHPMWIHPFIDIHVAAVDREAARQAILRARDVRMPSSPHPGCPFVHRRRAAAPSGRRSAWPYTARSPSSPGSGGELVGRHRTLIDEMHRSGHEIAVHGWTHARLPRASRRARGQPQGHGGRPLRHHRRPPRWYRPSFGVATLASRDAARDAGLTAVLWTAWGRDWSRFVTADGIVRRVNWTLRPGGTVLLHDTDRYSAPDSWRRTDQALTTLLHQWNEQEIPVGPLAEHWGPLPDGVADGILSYQRYPSRPCVSEGPMVHDSSTSASPAASTAGAAPFGTDPTGPSTPPNPRPPRPGPRRASTT